MVQWRPQRLTTEQLEERRLTAASYFSQGRSGRVKQNEIARAVGVGRQTVSRWYATWQAEGRAGLKRRPKTGRPCRLDDAQWISLARPMRERGLRSPPNNRREGQTTPLA